MDKITKYRGIPVIAILFSVFLFLRLYHLGLHDFWYDEIFSVRYSYSPFSNYNAPLYWILLHFWVKVSGVSEFALRLPSLIFSFLSVIMTYILGKEIFNKKTGLFASILMGLSPFQLWYAQEARNYAMVLFLGLLSSYLFFRLLKKENSVKLWILFVLVSVAGLYTSYFYIILFLTQCLYFVFYKKVKIRAWEIIFLLAVAASFYFYLRIFVDQFRFVWEGFWLPKPGWKSLVITLENFSLGFNGFSAPCIIFDILAGVFLISGLFRSLRNERLKQPFVFCAVMFFIPLIATFIFSRMFFSIYLDRGLIIFSPFYYLLLSLGIISLPKRARIILFASAVSLMLLGDYAYFKDYMRMPVEHHLGTYIKKPVKPLVEFLESSLLPEDIVAFANVSSMPSIGFYGGNKLSPLYYLFDPQFPDRDWQRPIKESKFSVPMYKINSLPAKRIWLICSDWARSGALDDNSQSVKNWCDKSFLLDFSFDFYGLRIFRYSKR